MSLFKFIAWFAIGAVGTILLASFLNNNFVLGFFIGLVIGVLGARD